MPNTVFTVREIALILGENNLDSIKSKVSYYLKKGVLVRLRNGIYAKSSGYEIFEAANKIFTPSYISLETVLQREGVTFQDYGKTIFVVSYQAREIKLGGYTINFKKIKNSALTSQMGINVEGGYSIANKERAFLDAVYLYGEYHFDNLDSIDWEYAKGILPIYESKIMETRFKNYVKYHSS